MTGRKRETIASHGDKRYIRRDERGWISESVAVSASLAQDVKQNVKNVAKRGHGDKGDRKPKS